MSRRYPYIVIDAPGHYGDHGTVWSRHRTLAAARKAKGQTAVVAHNHSDARRGSVFHRTSAPTPLLPERTIADVLWSFVVDAEDMYGCEVHSDIDEGHNLTVLAAEARRVLGKPPKEEK